MSSGYWRTKKQIEPLGNGGPTTKLVMDYERIWRERCYSDGIPDELPPKLAASGRVPSWKAVALCLLKNDMQLRGLGFGRQESAVVEAIYAIEKKEKSKQIAFDFF